MKTFILIKCLLIWTCVRGSQSSQGKIFTSDPIFSSPPSVDCGTLDITEHEIKEAFAYAQRQAESRIKDENEFQKTDYYLPMNVVSLKARMLATTANKTMSIHRNQLLFEDATRFLTEKKGITESQSVCLQNVKLPEDLLEVQQCRQLQETSCDREAKYRTADGSCNNLDNPSWGKSYSCYSRLLPASYSDGISSPRVSRINNQSLPNVRFLSAKISRNANLTSKTYTHMMVGFGQMLAHDMASTSAISAGDDGFYYTCCPKNSSVTFPEACIPTDIPEDDYFYSTIKPKVTCLDFIRNTGCSSGCNLGSARGQANEQTGYIDASTIYGTTEKKSQSLRTKHKGLLLSQNTKTGHLLPANFDPKFDQCSQIMSKGCSCFQSGDGRTNMQPGLTAMHTIFHKLHNEIVTVLAQDSPNTTDETLFQEGRRIVGALMQSLTYREIAPLVLGPKMMDFFNLPVKEMGYTTYDPKVDPRPFTESFSGPFRFGHSLAQNNFQMFDNYERKEDDIYLRDNMVHPEEICKGKRDDITRGLYHQGAQNFDRHFSDALSNHLVQIPGAEFGFDLVSMNLQRGRDHGLPPYPDLLEYCYNMTIKTFSDLESVMTSDNWKMLEDAYKTVRDVDAYTGGFMETPLPEAIVGPTFACLIGKQLHNSKFGDRFWFEHGNQAGSFSSGQLKELRKASLAKIICIGSDNITMITRHVFQIMDSQNPLVSCESIEGPNFKNWLKPIQ